jgi:serine/threonine-protein kinase RsbW
MQLKLSLSLPRDRASVSISRTVASQALTTLGVRKDCTSDIEVALTEACSNVLNHALDDDQYDVTVGVDGDLCIIEVIDTGHGFDSSLLGVDDADPSAEQGRGIQLMRALVDRALFTSRASQGTVVHLEKQIAWDDDAIVRLLDPA